MTAFNAVRFKVKPGREQELLDAHKNVAAAWSGLTHANMIKTGESAYPYPRFPGTMKCASRGNFSAMSVDTPKFVANTPTGFVESHADKSFD